MQQYARTIGIVLITILLVVAYVALQPNAVPPKGALTRYVPRDATFVLLLRRDFAHDGIGSLAERIPQIGDAAQFIRTEWDTLENALGMRIDSAVWYFRAQSGTSGLLLAMPSSLSKDQTVSLTSKKYSLLSVNNAASADATLVAPSVIRIAASGETGELHDELFKSRTAGAAVYAGGSFPRVIREFAIGLGMNENAAIFPLTAYADDLGGVFRLQTSASDAPPETRVLDLMIPKDADIVLDGLPKQDGVALNELQPLAPVIAGFESALSKSYSVPTDLITDQLLHTDTLVLRDDDWMLASRSTTTLAEFASELMSWTTPRIRETKLPDRTVYREYVRTSVAKQLAEADGNSIIFWGAASTTPQNDANSGIYGLSNGDQMVITNRRELLATTGKDTQKIFDFPQVASCIKGSVLIGKPYSIFADFSKKNALSQPFISIFGASEIKGADVYLTCL